MRNVRILIYATLLVFFCSAMTLAEQNRPPRMASRLSRLVNINGVKLHQEKLQRIARRNGNNRSAGSRGFEESARYVHSRLKALGYNVKIQGFKFPHFQELSDPFMQRTLPEAEPYPVKDPAGFYTIMFSGKGDIEGTVVPVDVVMPPGETPNTSNSGCEDDDFAGFPAGGIALIQRGSCWSYEKAKNAQDAGATAVIIYNEGQEGRTDALPNSSLERPEFNIPVVFASYAIGQELYGLSQTQGVRVCIKTDTQVKMLPTRNILATTKTGNPSRKVIVGSHLDSAPEGPGINDNGSGVAAILETATRMAQCGIRPKNQVVFAFWAAEEVGLLGSYYYVSKLIEEELSNISLYLNFDMIGSPNWVRFVSDGDGSDTGMDCPPGSEIIEQVFLNYFQRRNMPVDPDEMNGASDYAPFMEAGIPIGELFTGANGLKTEEQAAIYGGEAGKPYDSNYHTAKDTVKNASFTVEKQMIAAIGYVVGYFAIKPLPVQESRKLRAARSLSFEYRGPLIVR